MACIQAQEFHFETLTAREGLPQSTVYALLQDADGYIWLGTDGGGLCRYDGYRLKRYGRDQGIPANVIRDLAADRAGNLWVATSEGLYRSDADKFRLVKDGAYFFSLLADSRQNIWAGTMGQGVFRLQTRGDTGYVVTHAGSADGLGSDHIFDLCENDDGSILAAAYGSGISRIDPASGKIHSFSAEGLEQTISLFCAHGELYAGTRNNGAFLVRLQEDGVQVAAVPHTAGQTVWSFARDRSGNLFVATDRSGVVSSAGLRLDAASGLPGNEVLKLLTDRENNLWIGTNGSGVCRWPGKTFTHYKIPEGAVTALTGLAGKALWAGSRSGGGRSFNIHLNADGLSPRPESNTWPSAAVTALTHDRTKRLLIGTREGLVTWSGDNKQVYGTREGLADPVVSCLLADRHGALWVGTPAGLSRSEGGGNFTSLTVNNGLLHNEVQCLAEDGDGHVWIGTLGGIMKFDGRKLYGFFGEDGLSEPRVLCVAVGPGNEIFAGTFGGGIFMTRPAADHRHRFEQVCGEASLGSGNITTLVFENDSVLLATTNLGLHRITLDGRGRARQVVHYGRASGFARAEVNQNCAWRDRVSGRVFYGTDQGITLYDPAERWSPDTPPAVRVTAFRVNGRTVDTSGKLSLSHDENAVTVEFVSIRLSDPAGNRYFARLKGFEDEWTRLVIDPLSQDAFLKVSYKGLPPGEYELLLRSEDASGGATQLSAARFVIAPPFYVRPVFLIFCLIALVGLTALFVKMRERALVRDKLRLETIVEQRTAEVVRSKRRIEAQKELLQQQKTEIMDSITYSRRIQNAILPEAGELYQYFPGSFILYKPKDIVSGDFYFFGSQQQRRFVAVADCTGHGVPGAFMSLLGSRELSEAIRFGEGPGATLARLNQGVRQALKQDGGEGIRDGMDIALLTVEPGSSDKENVVRFAGANRPLWILRKATGTIEEIRPTKAAIGGFTPASQVFEEKAFVALQGDRIYLFSDGYADQFGGDSGKKMMTRRFRSVLTETGNLGMEVQKEKLAAYFDDWKGPNNAQVDDVLVIGVTL